MTNPNHSPAKTSLHEQIEIINRRLDALRPRLVEAEAELAERLAAISAFEFKLRARIAKLTEKLDMLESAIAELKRKMRWLGEGWQTDPENEAAAWAAGKSATEEGDYRYRDVHKEPQQRLEEEEKASLKQLYRQLARRFHPDMAVDEARPRIPHPDDVGDQCRLCCRGFREAGAASVGTRCAAHDFDPIRRGATRVANERINARAKSAGGN